MPSTIIPAAGGGQGVWTGPGALTKATPQLPAFAKTGAQALGVQNDIAVAVHGVALYFAANTPIVMPALVAGTDYAIYACTDGTLRADSDWSAPAGYDGTDSLKVGGFHYGLVAPGTTVAGGQFASGGNGMIWTQADVDRIAKETDDRHSAASQQQPLEQFAVARREVVQQG